MNYFKLMVFIQKGDKDLFGIPVSQQKSFLQKLGAPRDDIDRSFKQYQCQNLFTKKWKIFLLNISSLILAPILLLALLTKGLFVRKGASIEAIASFPLEMNIFPVELLREFKVDDTKWGKGRSLQMSDVSFLMKIFLRGLFHPYFVCKSFYILSSYSDMITKHTPKALLAHCEYSFSSSLLTAYCHKKGVLHINTMHGEKFFYIRDAYVNFDRFYVWDEHYKNLFAEMNAEPSQFRVFTPMSLKFDCNRYVNKNSYADFKYYLQICNESELCQIISILKDLEVEGKTFKLRPHPRYSDMKLLHKLLDNNHIEVPSEVRIEESIANSRYVIGSFTTVLNQAYYSGRTAVLDDVVFKEQYEKLKEIRFVMTEKDTIKLSELMKQ